MARSCPQLTELRIEVILQGSSEKEFYRLFANHFMPRLTKLHWTWFCPMNNSPWPWMTTDEEAKGNQSNRTVSNSQAFPELQELTAYISVLTLSIEQKINKMWMSGRVDGWMGKYPSCFAINAVPLFQW
ncbi:MAG: hypothetical protein BYD32DRAFT_423985 [Podila humilis]|nr:MAG: hypothetical protein BYD32DRAFT_423985 [Podila humilis]